jgi:hypothetical protein
MYLASKDSYAKSTEKQIKFHWLASFLCATNVVLITLFITTFGLKANTLT